MLEFSKGLKYPWGAPNGLWNIFWMLLPIFGWFALGGYGKKIINSIVRGNTKTLPEFGGFWDNFVTGIMLFLKMLPLMAILIAFNLFLGSIKDMGVLSWLLWVAYISFSIFIMPWIGVNLMEKYTVASTFEFNTAAKTVFGNFVDYLIAMVKTIGYVIIYAVLIVVLIGIPCLVFGQKLFIANFYANAQA